MSKIRKCSKNGRFYEGDSCPDCNDKGEEILDHGRRRKVSKFISGVLRHFPEEYDLRLDNRGWIKTVDLIEVCKEKYNWIDSEMILAVVATDPKGRFEVDGHKIRASYGHSVNHVDLEDNNQAVPDKLYHGTEPSNVDSIMKEGLKPMNRKHVHMTDDIEEARHVAERHCASPVILEIDAEGMLSEGESVTKRSQVIYTSDTVPPNYIEETGY